MEAKSEHNWLNGVIEEVKSFLSVSRAYIGSEQVEEKKKGDSQLKYVQQYSVYGPVLG